MRKNKPVYIFILVIAIFAIGIFFGVRSNWGIFKERKTPLDAEKSNNYVAEHSDHDDEEHEEKTEISGSSTVQDALDLGITKQKLEEALQGAVDNPDEIIKDIASQRGLSFGKVKEALNILINK